MKSKPDNKSKAYNSLVSKMGVVSLVKKDKDPLAAPSKKEAAAKCLHPHVKFSRRGFQINCLDCPRRWVAAYDQDGINYDIADFSYANDGIPEGEFRHSPNETQRTFPIR